MKLWLKRRLPARVWSNLATVSILAALGVLALGFLSLQNSRLESCRRTYQSFPLMFKPFFPPGPQESWTPMQRRNWGKLQTRADELAAQCGRQIHPFLVK